MTEADRPGLRMMRAILEGKTPEPPIAKLLGLGMSSVDPGKAVFTLEATAAMANPMGTLHGGVLCDLGDAAMGCAMGTTIGEGESYTTLELKINFFKPVWKQKLTATAKVVKRSSSIGYVECDVTDEKGNLVARLGSTCMVLRGDAAQGR